MITIFGAARQRCSIKPEISSVLWDWKILMESPESFLSSAQANDTRKTNRKTLKTRFGDQIPESHWSYQKPATHKLKQIELYGPKLKAYNQSTAKKWTQSNIHSLNTSLIIARALREIRYYQKTTGTILSRTLLRRLVREIVEKLTQKRLRISEEAHAAIHLAAEPYLVRWFEMLYNLPKSLSNSSNLAAVHAKRQTVMPRDSAFIRQLVQIWDPNDIMAEPVTKYPGKRRIDYGGHRGARSGGANRPRVGLGIEKGNLLRGGLTKKSRKRKNVDNVALN